MNLSTNSKSIWIQDGVSEQLKTVTALNETIYWIKSGMEEIFAWKIDQNVRRLKLLNPQSIQDEPFGAALKAGQMEPILYPHCQPGHHRCAHFCLLSNTAQGYVCSCMDGFLLQLDGFTCEEFNYRNESNKEKAHESEPSVAEEEAWQLYLEKVQKVQSHTNVIQNKTETRAKNPSAG